MEGMDCARYRTVLSARLDGEATAEESAAADRHLAGCARCRAVVAGYERLGVLARAYRTPPVRGVSLEPAVGAGARLRGRVARFVHDLVRAAGARRSVGSAGSGATAPVPVCHAEAPLHTVGASPCGCAAHCRCGCQDGTPCRCRSDAA